MAKTPEQLNKEIREAKAKLGDSKKKTGLRGEFSKLTDKIKKAELDLMRAKADVKTLRGATKGNWQLRQRDVEKLKKQIQQLRADKKRVGAEIAKARLPMQEAKKPLSEAKAKLFELRMKQYTNAPEKVQIPLAPKNDAIKEEIKKTEREIRLLRGLTVKDVMAKDAQRANDVKQETKRTRQAPAKKKARVNDEVVLTKDFKEAGKKVLEEGLASMANASIVKGPDLKEIPKLNKIEPKVTLIPHVKKNGKVSKRKVDIMLTDADGKPFVLSEKMFTKIVNHGASFTDNDQKAAVAWQTYVEGVKNGMVKPETIASFFKGQVNMDYVAPEITKAAKESVARHQANTNDPMNKIGVINAPKEETLEVKIHNEFDNVKEKTTPEAKSQLTDEQAQQVVNQYMQNRKARD